MAIEANGMIMMVVIPSRIWDTRKCSKNDEINVLIKPNTAEGITIRTKTASTVPNVIHQLPVTNDQLLFKEFITPLSSRTTAQTAKFQRIKRNTIKGIPIRMNDSRRGMISSIGNAIDKPISFIERDKA